MWQWMVNHQLVIGMGLMWVLSNAISAMPTPRDGSSAFYQWLFKFSQALGGALARLMAVYAPDTLSALTGQSVHTTVPPNPPLTAAELGSGTDGKN
jgi:hypothetical protein